MESRGLSGTLADAGGSAISFSNLPSTVALPGLDIKPLPPPPAAGQVTQSSSRSSSSHGQDTTGLADAPARGSVAYRLGPDGRRRIGSAHDVPTGSMTDLSDSASMADLIESFAGPARHGSTESARWDPNSEPHASDSTLDGEPAAADRTDDGTDATTEASTDTVVRYDRFAAAFTVAGSESEGVDEPGVTLTISTATPEPQASPGPAKATSVGPATALASSSRVSLHSDPRTSEHPRGMGGSTEWCAQRETLHGHSPRRTCWSCATAD